MESMEGQIGRSEAPAHSMRLAELAYSVAVIYLPALCSQAEFPSVSAGLLLFHCSLPSTLPDVFQKS